MAYALIRPKFILEWCEFKRAARDRGSALICGRDGEHRELNRKFGFVDADQHVPIGRKTSQHMGYQKAYNEIEGKFRQTYDALPKLEEDWLSEKSVTIFEYLLLDNYEIGDTAHFLDRLSKHIDAGPHQIVRIKAQSLLKYWSGEYRVAGLFTRLRMEVSDFTFAARRCRRYFGIKIWHFEKNREIALYKRIWISELKQQFDRLEASPPR